jgi:4-methylaminobutanoate oxidase (formaldehyde-forming)
MARRIVIVGGGVIGASVAWHLADRGLGDVILLERDRLGSGTTWHSAGNITWRFSPGHDAPVHGMFRTIERLTVETGQGKAGIGHRLARGAAEEVLVPQERGGHRTWSATRRSQTS